MMCKVFGMIALLVCLPFRFQRTRTGKIASKSALKGVAAKATRALPIVCRQVPKLAQESALRCRRLSSILGGSIYRLLG